LITQEAFMSNTATRLITLIMLLQRRQNQKASELARELGVSVRTLHRYFNMLDEMGIPVYSERGPYGGFSLVRGYRMPPLVFTPEEAVAVYLGSSMVGEVWGSLYQEAAQGALAKLDNVLPIEQRNEVTWARRSLITTGMHRADLTDLTPTLENLRRAVRDLRQVEMIYRSSNNPEPRSRRVDPYALVYRWGWWYVIGYCHLREAIRSFRMDRIEKLTLLSLVFRRPDDFNICEYLTSEIQAQPQVRACFSFTPQAAHIALSCRASWETLQEQPDGSVLVTMSAPDMPWLASTAFSFGPWVTVLEPEELRQMVREWADEVIRLYTSEDDRNKTTETQRAQRE
jgi:predicted DNA-binding transcriptional regulator YafY